MDLRHLRRGYCVLFCFGLLHPLSLIVLSPSLEALELLQYIPTSWRQSIFPDHNVDANAPLPTNT